MAIVNEKYTAAKPVQVDPKTGKPLPTGRDSPNPQSLEDNKDEGYFSRLLGRNKKKMAAMEPPPPVLKASGNLSERENIEVDVIKLLITSYFNIVRRTMIDMVPKAIMLNLVSYVPIEFLVFIGVSTDTLHRHSKEEMQRELLENLYKSDELDDLLKESEYTVRRRKECAQMVESLTKAAEIVNTVG